MRRAALPALLRSAPVGIALLCSPGAARADGAFPDETQLLLPATSPHRMVLGTNFGVLQSDDDGQHWRLVCEGFISGRYLVQMYGVAADGALLAAYGSAVARSGDQGCSWTTASGLQNVETRDLWADPTDPGSSWLIATDVSGATGANGLYHSADSAASFALALAEPHGDLMGVESARSAPGDVLVAGYLTNPDGGDNIPYTTRSTDTGQHWTQTLHPELMPRRIAIAQVDPADPLTAYLRVGLSTGNDALGITHDGGQTIQLALELGEPMSSFALGEDGTLYVGSRLGHLWVRRPGESDFTRKPGPALRCLGARGGLLYACGGDDTDLFTLASSTDHGDSFQPLLRLSQLDALPDCAPVQNACLPALHTLQKQVGYQGPNGPPSDSPTTPAKKGCGCTTGDAPGLGLLALTALARRRRR